MNRAEKILDEKSVKNGKCFGNSRAIVEASEAYNAMKEIAWEAWKERARTALGELYNEHAQGHLFEQWYNKQIET